MYVVLGSRGSRFGSAVADALHAAKVAAQRVHVLDLDAPFDGEALSVGPDFVAWRGLELTSASAILLERPLFAWPQPIGGEARRELAALRLSAVLALAERVPVLNPPHAAELALAPVLALDALAARGFAVQPWRFGPRDGAGAWRDALGRVADYEPRMPEPGEPAWAPEPFDGALTTVFVAGDTIAASAEHRDLAAWSAEAAASSAIAPDRLSDELATLARRATAELGLAFAAVTLRVDGASVVDVDAAPDLAAWDHARSGAIARAAADLLVHAAAQAERSRTP
ncbi:MAG: hypothetical protein IT453_01385 [Planctomycetes bacterium]|nr:hypothetical protein [Planctomycetota bacterium]